MAKTLQALLLRRSFNAQLETPLGPGSDKSQRGAGPRNGATRGHEGNGRDNARRRRTTGSVGFPCASPPPVALQTTAAGGPLRPLPQSFEPSMIASSDVELLGPGEARADSRPTPSSAPSEAAMRGQCWECRRRAGRVGWRVGSLLAAGASDPGAEAVRTHGRCRRRRLTDGPVGPKGRDGFRRSDGQQESQTCLHTRPCSPTLRPPSRSPVGAPQGEEWAGPQCHIERAKAASVLARRRGWQNGLSQNPFGYTTQNCTGYEVLSVL